MDQNFPKPISMNLGGNLSSPRNMAVEVVLLLIIIVLFGWFLVLPKKAEVDSAAAQLITLQGQESQMAQTLKTTQDLVSQMNSDQQDVTLLDQALPLDGGTNTLQLLLQGYAQSSGVTIGNINVAGKPDAIVAGDKALLANPFGATRTLQTLSGSVFVIGTFDQLQAFLQKMENSGRLMDITSLSLDSLTPGGLNLNVSFNAYYFAPY